MLDTNQSARSRSRATRSVAAAAPGPHVTAPTSTSLRAKRSGWAAALAALSKDPSTPMLSRVIAGIVAFCTLHVWAVLLASAVLAGVGGTYAAKHFSINADVTKLISPHVPWRERELAYESVFTNGTGLIAAVIDAPTPELASAATDALVGRL